jgi:hypothetical protein
MPLARIPGDPLPTYDDLTKHGYDGPWPPSGLLDQQKCFSAKSAWKEVLLTRDPNAFLVPGVQNQNWYNDYLWSDKNWKRQKRRVVKGADGNCQCCGASATEVHHRDYRPRVLAGDDDSPLVAICRPCHDKVHNDGTRRRQWDESECVLQELVSARDEHELAWRNAAMVVG